MFTEQEVNTLKGLFYAAAHTPADIPPKAYNEEFSRQLTEYFKCFPNSDIPEETTYLGGDSPHDDEAAEFDATYFPEKK